MNSTAVGNQLEGAIFKLFQSEIEADRFLAKKGNCKLLLKKGYYSRDRKTEIIFDLSIEIFLPGARDFSVLIVIECKNYANHSVPVDDIEEFFAKVQQVGAANSKAIIVSTAAFQSGALEYARAKGIGLLRYFGPEKFKWELYRSPSASSRGTLPDAEYAVIAGLTQTDFHSEAFDLLFQSPRRATNSLWDFFKDILVDTLPPEQLRKITNTQTRQVNIVPFRNKSELEALAAEALDQIEYMSGPVALAEICQRESERSGLIVRTGVPPEKVGKSPALGRIQFDPPCIEIFIQDEPHLGRDRFTLAHELAHYLLQHGNYICREICEESDFVLYRSGLDNGSDVARLEFQANYLASSLLLPRANFIADFWRLVRLLDIQDRGYGPLYVDSQTCNVENYMAVTGLLRGRYQVSRSSVRIRLIGLGLLRDVRDKCDSVR
jgi:Zn-dependent peptidase ImmA (M78 family)